MVAYSSYIIVTTTIIILTTESSPPSAPLSLTNTIVTNILTHPHQQSSPSLSPSHHQLNSSPSSSPRNLWNLVTLLCQTCRSIRTFVLFSCWVLLCQFFQLRIFKCRGENMGKFKTTTERWEFHSHHAVVLIALSFAHACVFYCLCHFAFCHLHLTYCIFQFGQTLHICS